MKVISLLLLIHILNIRMSARKPARRSILNALSNTTGVLINEGSRNKTKRITGNVKTDLKSEYESLLFVIKNAMNRYGITKCASANRGQGYRLVSQVAKKRKSASLKFSNPAKMKGKLIRISLIVVLSPKLFRKKVSGKTLAVAINMYRRFL